MQAFRQLTGLVAPLDRVNVDTDQIIPKQLLKTIKRTGLREGLFYDWRKQKDGSQDPAFFLNQLRFQGATILLTRDVGKDRGFNWGGAIVAVAVFGSLTWAILETQSLAIEAPHMAMLTVKRIGAALMTTYVWPLQCVGILLTAALIGALILAMEERR